MKTEKITPPTWLLMAIFAMLILHFLFPAARIVPPVWNLAGLLLVAPGVVMNLIADKAFHQARTTVKPFEEPTALVTDGVFRISRNPMYLGFVLVLIGVTILLASLSPWLVAIAFAILMDRMYITAEERAMHARFGQAYSDYSRRVRRWL